MCVLLLALGAYGFVELGAFLAKEDPLQKADAIVVLAGGGINRQLEAVDLYLAGHAASIVLTRDIEDPAVVALAARGVQFPDPFERTIEVFEQLGVARDAIVIPPERHGSTAAEAVTMRKLSAARSWRRLIVVSSKYHLRRAGFAFRRELRGMEVDVQMRGTRYDPSDPERWWRNRADLRAAVPEAMKLVAYVLGLGA